MLKHVHGYLKKLNCDTYAKKNYTKYKNSNFVFVLGASLQKNKQVKIVKLQCCKLIASL